MSIQLRIKHTTGYAYDTLAAASYNEARMTPLTTPEQFLLHSRVDVTPTPWTQEFRDYWGTTVTAFEVHEPHAELTVVASSLVETSASAPQPHHLAWDVLADVEDRYSELLANDHWTAPPAALLDELAPLRAESQTPTAYARAVCSFLHERLAYVRGATEVTTTAADAWAAGSGVCQDFAHLAVGLLREAGIPARYVSGYLHPATDPVVGDTVVGESHAWVEWWDGEWVGYDPTNDVAPSGRHVIVGRVRSYADSPPLRGIYSSGGTSQMFVGVEITRVR